MIFTPLNKKELEDAVNKWLIKPIETSRLVGDISEWNVSRVTDMSRMFRQAENFNGNVSW